MTWTSDRYILEAELVPPQRPYAEQSRRIVHREVLRGESTEPEYLLWLQGDGKHPRVIMFEDGSALRLVVRNAEHATGTQPLRAYAELIRNCWQHNAASIRELCERQAEARRVQVRELEQRMLGGREEI